MENDFVFSFLKWASQWNVLLAIPLLPLLLMWPIGNKLVRYRWIFLSLGGSVFFLLKLAQHLLFQNQAFDLGLFTNLIWQLSHTGSLTSSILGLHYFGTHFSPYIYLLTTGIWLWPSPLFLTTLQSLALTAAMIPLYRIAQRHLCSPAAGIAFCLLFFAHPYVHQVHQFDFHSISLFIPLMLFIFDAFDENKPKTVMVLCLLAMTIKEDVSLAMFGLGIFWALSRPNQKKWGITLAGLSVSWACMTIFLIIPGFLNTDSVQLPRLFSYLGADFSEGFNKITENPFRFLHIVLSRPENYWSLFLYFLSFGFLPFLKRKAIVLWIFPVLLCFLSDHPVFSAFKAQYSALSLPLLFYSAVQGLAVFMNHAAQKYIRYVWAGMCSCSLLFLPAYFKPDTKQHLKSISTALRLIPQNASVSAQTTLVPRLACRNDIWMFPHLPPNASHIILDLHSPLIPAQELHSYANFILTNKNKIIFNDNGVVVLTRPFH